MAGEPTQQDKLLAYCRWALLVLLTVVFACLISWCYDVDGDQTNKDFSDPPETQPIEYTITLNQVNLRPHVRLLYILRLTLLPSGVRCNCDRIMDIGSYCHYVLLVHHLVV